jgi:lipopolysaccharide export system protein LptC
MTLREHKFYAYITIVALFSWLMLKMTGMIETSFNQVPTHSPDYSSKGYTKWEMNEFGTLKKKVLADEMIHYNDDGTTHMIVPIMTFINANKIMPPWVVKSETGVLSSDGKDLSLNGKVIIDRIKAQGVSPLRINTSELKVKPEINYAETVEWAELISELNITTGIGMNLTFTDPVHIQLLANVKGSYEKK